MSCQCYITTNAEPMNPDIKYRDDYIGMRFCELTVIGYPATKEGVRRAGAICRCDCGNEFSIWSMRELLNGLRKRCPSCAKKKASEDRRKRIAEHSSNPHLEYINERLYAVWRSMKHRCSDKSNKWYGAKGVKVCEEWQDYTVFRDWALSHGYDDQAPYGACTIDRINPFGDYEPSNCRWTDMNTQLHNKRRDWLRSQSCCNDERSE